VRDAGVESRDEPPPGPVPGPLVDVAEPPSDGSDEFKRAGEFEKADPSIFGFDMLLPRDQ
jgi:hypothetical protein